MRSPQTQGLSCEFLDASRDGVFLAIQLFQFTRMSYESVTEVLIFDGDDAKALSPLFA